MHFTSILLYVSAWTTPIVASANVFTVASETIQGQARVIYNEGQSVADEVKTGTSFSLFASGGEQSSKLDYTRTIDAANGQIEMSLSYVGHISDTPIPLDATTFTLNNKIVIQFDTPTIFSYSADLADIGIPLDYRYGATFSSVRFWNTENPYDEYYANRRDAITGSLSFTTSVLEPGTWAVEYSVRYWFSSPPTTRELTWDGTLSGTAVVPEPRAIHAIGLFMLLFSVAAIIRRRAQPLAATRRLPPS